MPYPLPLTRTEAYLAYKAGVITAESLKPSLSVPRTGIDAWLAYWTGLNNDYPKDDNGDPLCLTQEEAYVAYLSGVLNEYPENALHRVGAYLRYLISARWGRPDHPLNREELYLSLLKTQVIPSGDPSSDITIDGTCKAPFVDVNMYGDTYQQSYTGQNLYNVAEVPTGTYVTKDDDGWITITRDNTSGSSTVYTNVWTNNLALETSTQYKIFIEVKEASGTGSLFITSTNSTEGQFNSWQEKTLASMAAGQTYTVSPTTKSSFSGISKGLRTVLQQTAGQGGSVTFRLSVCASSTPTSTFSYEPYTGGEPSPSPSYPQQIQTVTGEQMVEVQGKNLLKLNDGATTLGGVPITTANGMVNLKGTATSGAQGYYVTINITASEPMVFSTNKNGTTSGLDIKLQYKRGGTTYYPTVGSSLSLQTGDIIQQMYLIVSNGAVLNGSFSPMLEKGSTKTSFEPYSKQSYPISLGSIELCKIGNYQDHIWEDNGEWKIHREITQKVFNGSESWSKSNATLNNVYIQVDASIKKNTAVKSNKLTEYAASYMQVNSVVGIAYNTTGADEASIRISCGIGGASNVPAFRSWLNGVSPTAYYAKATPTEDTITNQSLIQQLNALKNGGAENGTTYIKVNATDPNLPGLLVVEAPKYE